MRQLPDGLDVVDPDAVLKGTDEAALVLVEPDLLKLAPSAGKAQPRGRHDAGSLKERLSSLSRTIKNSHKQDEKYGILKK